MKTIVITGAASGLGKALALLYSTKNWHVIIADIQDQVGQEVVDQINAQGGSAYYCHCDILRRTNPVGQACCEQQ